MIIGIKEVVVVVSSKNVIRKVSTISTSLVGVGEGGIVATAITSS